MKKLNTLAAIVAMMTTLSLTSVAEEKTHELSQGINDLGNNILQQIRKTENDKNLFISPLSLHEALSMVYVGSYQETREELAKLLGVNLKDSNKDVADQWVQLRKEILASDPQVKLAIANSMWANEELKVRFKPDFMKLNQRAHDAELRTMPFHAPEFLTTLNGWVAKNTMNKITNILNPPIPKEQLFYLVNAIYFKGAWSVAFDPKQTRADQFTLNDGKIKNVKMMIQDGRFRYTDTRFGGQLVEVPFGKTGNMVMSLHLPSSMTKDKFYTNIGENLDKMRDSLSRRKGTVSIPRFHVEYLNEKVVDVLKALGVKNVFSDDADLSGVAEGEEAKVNKIIHKAVIDATEEGAEAAAATVVGGARSTTSRPETPFHFEANRPFYFDIRDTKSGVTLFSGVVNNPEEPK